jgi:hypothetical protein
MYQRQLEAKRRQRVDAEKKAGDLRAKEADKRAAASKRVQSASRTTNASMAASRMREAARREAEANAAGTEVARWQSRAAGYSKDEAALQAKLAKAQHAEQEDAERRRRRDQATADRLAAVERISIRERLDATETLVSGVLRDLPPPKPERLRILMLGAASEGDLRVGREQARIRRAVERATLRDLVDLEGHPSATAEDLRDRISAFRTHVIHF